MTNQTWKQKQISSKEDKIINATLIALTIIIGSIAYGTDILQALAGKI